MNDPIRDLGELLDESGASTLGELGQTLTSVLDLDEQLTIAQASDGTLAVTIGNDSYDIAFPTSWDTLIRFLVGITADEDENADGEPDSDLLID